MWVRGVDVGEGFAEVGVELFWAFEHWVVAGEVERDDAAVGGEGVELLAPEGAVTGPAMNEDEGGTALAAHITGNLDAVRGTGCGGDDGSCYRIGVEAFVASHQTMATVLSLRYCARRFLYIRWASSLIYRKRSPK